MIEIDENMELKRIVMPEYAGKDELRVRNPSARRHKPRHAAADKEKPEQRPGDRRDKPGLFPDEFLVFPRNDNVDGVSLYHAVSCRNAQPSLMSSPGEAAVSSLISLPVSLRKTSLSVGLCILTDRTLSPISRMILGMQTSPLSADMKISPSLSATSTSRMFLHVLYRLFVVRGLQIYHIPSDHLLELLRAFPML